MHKLINKMHILGYVNKVSIKIDTILFERRNIPLEYFYRVEVYLYYITNTYMVLCFYIFSAFS